MPLNTKKISKSFSNAAASWFPLSSRSTSKSSSTSATSTFSSQSHQGRLPDDLLLDARRRSFQSKTTCLSDG